MNEYLYYESKATLIFKKIAASGVDFDKYKVNVTAFLNYMNKGFKNNMDMYKISIPNLLDIKLENIIDAKYKFLLRGIDLKHTILFLTELETRIKDFEKKPTNLKLLVGTYFLQYVIITKIVEAYLGAVSTYNVSDPNNINYTLRDIGIDSSILKYYLMFEDLRQKTIDDWLNLSIDAMEEQYITSAFKRILVILGAQ